ncbi:MAG: TraR/DksA family transcriptional regulator [Bacteroidia bacterium]|nr:TraR/DksA family transcriptional regulator [Bacteroidia bacterium]MDW8301057.1 TraR/DksA family transcriptional regulator [Bacteroidia bacterium]
MSERKTCYSREELEVFKKIILRKLDSAREELKIYQEILSRELDSASDGTPYSAHIADVGSDAMEKEKANLIVSRQAKFISHLEAALKRIEKGTYGINKDCKDEPKMLCDTCPLIQKERLMIVPHTQTCVQMKKLQKD